MTGWEPATEAEVALAAALKVNDQEGYFRILSRLELFLPVSADSLAGRAPMGWGTWSTGGRTHVLAFTSPTAMRICLGESAASARQLRYAELASAWPSAEWWLAVNPGLPIEGYLPAWFVAQLARGDSRLPGREGVMAASPSAADRDERPASTGRASALPGVQAPAPPVGQQSAPPAGQRPPVARARATAAVPPPSYAPAREAPAAPARAEARPAAAASSPAAALGAGSNPSTGGIAGAVPGWRGTAPTNAGDGPNGLPRRPMPDERHEPDGSVATAVRQPAIPPARSDVQPQRPAADSPARGSATAPVPTDSPARGSVAAPAPPSGPVRTATATAAAATAMPEGTGGTPAATTEPSPATSREFTPANDVESSLLEAAGEGSTDSFLSTLLLATVALPVAPGSAPGARPGDAGFVWRTESLDGEPYVVVFTSPERLAEHLGGRVDTVAVRFVQLIRRWPDEAWSFAVNPGTPIGAKLPGREIVALANWAAEVGLGDDADRGEEPAGGPDPAPQPAPAAGQPEQARATIMQKAIAPAQIDYYLERGYDRVSGFVHRASELAHLTTPAQLYAALGLGYPNSPFSPHAPEVYVLRWPVHRPGLYRIPYGGQSEQAMRAMQGWVIERPPFRGNGFAPGDSSDVVAEFKVDSVRLPHGAQLWRLGADGTERLIATLDADGPQWLPAEEV